MSGLRAFLTLSRASMLPTVWSNCLAGWWLGGAGNEEKLGFLLAGVTCLYLGGAFLNDAFDAAFDRQHRRTRPVPLGVVPESAVWGWGLVWLIVGAIALFWVAPLTAGLGLGLAFWLVLYNGIHRYVTFSPLLLGICRLFVYLIAASMSLDGVAGWAIWCGVAQAVYVAGVGFPLRRENPAEPLRYWPLALLAFPVFLAGIMNANEYREAGVLLSVVLGLWILNSIRHSLWSFEPSVPATAARLSAGMVFVDWLAVPDAPRQISVVFLALFFAVQLFQRLARPAAPKAG